MIKNKDNGFIGKVVISLIATLGTLALWVPVELQLMSKKLQNLI